MATRKYALVLSGGGFKGAFQVGAIEWLRKPENWKRFTGLDSPMHFDIVAGVSVGALNGVMVAMKQYEALNRLWADVVKNGGNEIYESDFIDARGRTSLNFTSIKNRLFPNLRLKIGLLFTLIFNKRRFYEKLGAMLEEELRENLPEFQSLATNNGLYQKLVANVKKEYIPADTKYLCGFVSIHDGKYHKVLSNEFITDDEFCKGILASSAMPIVWEPVDSIRFSRGGQPVTIRESVDGGLRNNSPLGDIIDFINADAASDYHIVVINCSSGKTEVQDKEWNIASIALRSLNDIAMEEIFNNDIETFQNINDLVTQAHAQNAVLTKTNEAGQKIPLRRFDCTIINPDAGVLGDTLSTEPSIMEERFRHGMQKAQDAFARA